MTETDIAWLAGLLEGEGCFRAGSKRLKAPAIKLSMTDEDVIRRAASYLNTRMGGGRNRCGSRRPVWDAHKSGIPALCTMLDVFPLMGTRRRTKISEVLELWEHSYGCLIIGGRPRDVQTGRYVRTNGNGGGK